MLVLESSVKRAMNSDSVMMVSLYDFRYIAIDPVTKAKTPTTLRLTDNKDIVAYNGNQYLPTPMKRSEFRQSNNGKIDDVTLSIGNMAEDRLIQQIIENNEVIGETVTVHEFFLDPETLIPIGSPIEIAFRVTAAKATRKQVDFTLSIGFDFLKAELPGRVLFGRFCRWNQFKDAYCKYNGPDETCGRTFDDCAAKDNVVNFGGAPGILNQRLYF